MLDKATLIVDIKNAFDSVSNNASADPQASRDKIANDLANAIDKYVKTATIKYATGLTAPPSAHQVVGTFQGNLE